MKKWLAPIILGLFGVIILCGLGIWQVQRLAEKEAQIAELEAHMNSDPIALENLQIDLSQSNGTPIVARGVFQDEHFDILTGNATGTGYRRVQAFQTANERIMIELGFFPQAMRNEIFALPQGEVEIKGHLYIPHKSNGKYDASANFWVGYNISEMAAQLDALPAMLIADQSPIKALQDEPMTIDLPNNHLQYAITWFSLAAAWALMSIYWGIRRNNERG